MKTSLILHSRPAGIVWTTNEAFLTSTDALTDSKPARATRVEFEGGAITDYVTLTGAWSTPTVLRGGWLIIDRGGVTGIKVQVRGKRIADGGYTYALGGNALTQRAIQRNDGTIAVAWVFAEGLDPVVGIEIRIYDDADGVIFSGGYLDIGEVFVGEGADIRIRREFGDTMDDPSLFEQSLGNQPHTVERKRAMVREIEICPVDFDDAYMAETSLTALRERLVGKRDCVLVTAFRQPATGGAGAIDYDVVQQMALFGKCTELGTLQSLAEGPYWTVRLVFRESPGRLTA